MPKEKGKNGPRRVPYWKNVKKHLDKKTKGLVHLGGGRIGGNNSSIPGGALKSERTSRKKSICSHKEGGTLIFH